MKKRFKRIYIEITNECNRNCSFCTNDKKPKRKMTLSEFEHVLKEIDPWTDYVYLHVKGEPLIHSNFKEILDLCRKYKKNVNLTTNGTNLLRQTDTIINFKIVRQINISLHQFKANESYLEDILTATEKILSSSPIYMNYRFWTLQNGKMTTNMEKMLRRIFDYFHLPKSLYKKIFATQNIELSPHLFLNKGDLFEWPTLEHAFVSDQGTCHGLRDHLAILSDGTVVPCCLDCAGINALGNISQESFSAILMKQETQKILQGFQNGHIVTPLCQRCTYRVRFSLHNHKVSE